jgi:hypothetical protein
LKSFPSGSTTKTELSMTTLHRLIPMPGSEANPFSRTHRRSTAILSAVRASEKTHSSSELAARYSLSFGVWEIGLKLTFRSFETKPRAFR